ncbi:U4/U6.U5 tri-snRNP-associated protein 2 [Cotesia glomerata]|uniref:Ubiquitin carboxyl-terminal hydrolase 39 n=1 Tax=Cotesia glomerata TaxID=32391 RepID=A0AAV7JA44_COTGL|nr:U4/U6.U5 tri-snRNP-associated protein 2 [Cotesia glomerata]KAH0568896.1 U4/U6.U5 tri-snRNP-associated protein 2 [Cotesia glomerata]
MAANTTSNNLKRKLSNRDSDSDNENENTSFSRKNKTDAPRLCPYLDTINRQFLDFDFEKLCSVSLSRINVYACLVCGKYFQGRGTNTHAYTHSVAESHHVFLNLHTLKFYCLPDNYEIVDSSLDDIKYVLNPTFGKEQIAQLDTSDKQSRAIDGSMYSPGIVGLNNIKANDYCNVILQALSHVTPLRNYFLREFNYSHVKRPPGDSQYLLVQRFGELMRKLWNSRNFKAHVSPHEMLQAVVLWSKKSFQFTEQGDPIDFLSWFLNALHIALNGSKKRDSSIIYKTFLGHMRIYTRKIPPLELEESQRSELLNTVEYGETVTESPFLYLTCDLPPPPLFKDQFTENIIPQVNLYTLLNKFNAFTEKEYKTYKENFLKRFEITELPPYLILYIKRFTKNTFFVEKNPTIVNFPVKNVDFGDILTPEVKARHPYTVYDLVANIVHEGEPGKGTYKVHILHRATGQWYEMQDLHVTQRLSQMITLSEAYIQIYELRKNDSTENGTKAN